MPSPMMSTVLRAGCGVLSLRQDGWLRAGLVVVILTGLICMATIDKPVALFVHSWLDENGRTVFHMTAKLGEGYFWYGGGIAVILAALAGRRISRLAATEALWWRIQRAALFFVSAHLMGSLLVPVIKVMVGRKRPKFLFNHDFYGFTPFTFRFGDICFPSGHTQTITTALVALAFILPDRRVVVPMAVLALLVGASRILEGVHFVSDVLMGAYVGAAAAVLVHRLFLQRGWNVRLIG